jgi:phosphoglycerate dehydrogenase-like enzyme
MPIDTILITYDLQPHHLAAIRQAAPGATQVVTDDRHDLGQRWDALAPHIEVVLGSLPRDRILAAPRLRWMQQTGAGVDWLLEHPEIAASDIILTNASGVHAIPISEHILALMLALARDIQRCLRAQVAHHWGHGHVVGELEGATMGLIGVGAIGEKTAAKAQALGMRVVGLRRFPDQPSPWVDQMVGPDGLHALLAQSDWVVITAPLTHETRGLIGEVELRAMKRSAYIINIGRGAIIQEAALVRALQEGWIAGAGLDVFAEEPLPATSPLWEMENVIITPHYAGSTPHYSDRLIAIFTENLRRYQAGEEMVNVVDKGMGY